MNAIDQLAEPPRPRWDGTRVLFEIVVGDEWVPCAISRGALQDLSARNHYKSADLLRCFANARNRIEAIAVDKLRARSGDQSGPLNIWADDIQDLPAGNGATPAAAGLGNDRAPVESHAKPRKDEQ
jgi:hypothetical protein